mmetsp:Transcript_100037/g.265891  ORF Transcript_100037/g.265891 Transcript_100037/m.265891 type:complete len:251 (-) Transcript_100037:112-864(-)
MSETLTPLSLPSSFHLSMAYSCFGRPSQKTTPKRPSTDTVSPTLKSATHLLGGARTGGVAAAASPRAGLLTLNNAQLVPGVAANLGGVEAAAEALTWTTSTPAKVGGDSAWLVVVPRDVNAGRQGVTSAACSDCRGPMSEQPGGPMRLPRPNQADLARGPPTGFGDRGSSVSSAQRRLLGSRTRSGENATCGLSGIAGATTVVAGTMAGSVACREPSVATQSTLLGFPFCTLGTRTWGSNGSTWACASLA